MANMLAKNSFGHSLTLGYRYNYLIYSRSVPLFSLKQAFELLYLGDKYELHELKSYCNNFILHNKRSLAGVPDVFTYLEMNEKCQSEEVTQFVWAQLRKHANVLIRLPQFQDLDFQTLEAFLCESDLNAHEWELLEAVRRWVAGNGVSVACQEEGGAGDCLHQLLECIRWKYTPVQECVMVQGWSEFQLSTDETFLTDILALQREDGPALSHNQVVANSVNKEYSSNRLYNSHQNFVIYTQITVDRDNNSISCLHGRKVSQLTYNQTKCHTVGPPFELSNFYIVPSYSLTSLSNNRVKLTVNLACQGKNFGEDLMMQRFHRNRPSYLRSLVRLTVFSFSPSNAARSLEKEVNFWPDRDSSSFVTLTFSKEEVSRYLRQPESDLNRTMDLQLQLEPLGEEAGGEGRATPPKVMRPDRPAPASPPHRNRDRSRSPPHPPYSPVPPSYSPLTSPSYSPRAPDYIPCSPHYIPSSPPRSPTVDLIQIMDDAEQDDAAVAVATVESLHQENVGLESDSDCEDERAPVAKKVTMSAESPDPPM